METFFCIIFLFLVAIIIIASVSAATYFLFYKKYRDRLHQPEKTDPNKGKIRLKYCLNCGSSLDKKHRCVECNIKY